MLPRAPCSGRPKAAAGKIADAWSLVHCDLPRETDPGRHTHPRAPQNNSATSKRSPDGSWTTPSGHIGQQRYGKCLQRHRGGCRRNALQRRGKRRRSSCRGLGMLLGLHLRQQGVIIGVGPGGGDHDLCGLGTGVAAAMSVVEHQPLFARGRHFDPRARSGLGSRLGDTASRTQRGRDQHQRVLRRPAPTRHPATLRQRATARSPRRDCLAGKANSRSC